MHSIKFHYKCNSFKWFNLISFDNQTANWLKNVIKKKQIFSTSFFFLNEKIISMRSSFVDITHSSFASSAPSLFHSDRIGNPFLFLSHCRAHIQLKYRTGMAIWTKPPRNQSADDARLGYRRFVPSGIHMSPSNVCCAYSSLIVTGTVVNRRTTFNQISTHIKYTFSALQKSRTKASRGGIDALAGAQTGMHAMHAHCSLLVGPSQSITLNE